MADHLPSNLDRLRDSITVHVQASSLRVVARQVGMSPSGLRKFLDGGLPYSKSRKKLYEWYHRQRGQLHSELTCGEISEAIGALIQELPPERRARAMSDLVETLAGLYAQYADACPPWLVELVARAPALVEALEPDGPAVAQPE
jgi:hypothetical protein